MNAMNAMNIDELAAIDVHTHAEVSSKGQASLSDDLHEAFRDDDRGEGALAERLEPRAEPGLGLHIGSGSD